ncbi:MAG: hypothetical protein M3P49_08435 [Actinomycetota bacterium]|nr:hypothetical protein [Actinomycetota bacterium]
MTEQPRDDITRRTSKEVADRLRVFLVEIWTARVQAGSLRLVQSSDEEYPAPKIVRDLGVSVDTLRKVNQAEVYAGHWKGLLTEEKVLPTLPSFGGANCTRTADRQAHPTCAICVRHKASCGKLMIVRARAHFEPGEPN